MFFKKKIRISSEIFLKHYRSIGKIIKKSPIKIPIVTTNDVVPMMISVSCKAAMDSKKDTEKIVEGPFMWWMDFQKTEFLKNTATKRIAFYANIIDGKTLIGDCIFNNGVNDSRSPAVACAIAFCDCWLNSNYVFDYENRMAKTHSAVEMHHFANKTVIPMMRVMNKLYIDIFKYA